MTIALPIFETIAGVAVLDAMSTRLRMWRERQDRRQSTSVDGRVEDRLRSLTLSTIESMLTVAAEEEYGIGAEHPRSDVRPHELDRSHRDRHGR